MAIAYMESIIDFSGTNKIIKPKNYFYEQH